MKVILMILALAVLLVLVAIVRTLLCPKKTVQYSPKCTEAEALALAKKLAEMVRCNTTSVPNETEIDKYLAFHEVLRRLFPRVHETLEQTVIDGNLLYRWAGKSADKPIVLMSHQDVVPAEGVWSHAPFSGDIAEGKVWGRGTADTKGSLMAFFEAVERLIAEGYVPAQDVYLVSSCTEEWGGGGASKLVEEFVRRGVKPWLLCDEGGAIITDPIAGITGNFAMIGVFEKGRANVRFSAKSRGGHASAPGKNTPVARLAAFVNDVEKHSPFRSRILPEVSRMFGRLGTYAPFGFRLILCNLWLFAPLLKAVMPMLSAQGAALMRTTVAFTKLSGSDAYNVLPQEATLVANLRYIPHQNEKETLAILEKLAKKHDLEMEVIDSRDYSTPVDIHGPAFRMFEQVVAETYPGLPSSPYVVTGATDAKYFQDICENCIRFAPLIYGPEQMKGMHGIDENIEYNCLPGAVAFYRNLITAMEGA